MLVEMVLVGLYYIDVFVVEVRYGVMEEVDGWDEVGVEDCD